MVIKGWFSWSWQILLLRGVAGVAFGLAAMTWPSGTVVTLVVLWAVWASFEGLAAFAQAFSPGVVGGARTALLALGTVALVAALLGFLRPGVTASLLTWALGVWLVVRGVAEIIGAFGARAAAPRVLLLASGALDAVLGVLFALNPGRGAVGIAVVLGAVALVWGLVLVTAAAVVRSELKDLAESDDFDPATS